MSKNVKKQLAFSFESTDKNPRVSPTTAKIATIFNFADVRQKKHVDEVRQALIEKGYIKSV